MSEVKVPAYWAPSEVPLSFPYTWSSPATSSRGRGDKGAFQGLFYKDTDLIQGPLPSRPHHLPKAPHPNTVTWKGGRISSYEFGGDTDIQSRVTVFFELCAKDAAASGRLGGPVG